MPGLRQLAVILLADRLGHNLCKVVSSIIALGYPAPMIVNWGSAPANGDGGIGASQLAKIAGTLNYLDWATDSRAPERLTLDDGDLVLILDAYDIWMQLPPSVLLRRYYMSNERANERLGRERQSNAGELLEQTVVVSAQKGRVAPRDSISNLHCDDIPGSTLPSGVYGPLTDFRFAGWKYMQPRCLNSGSFMGPVGDMKKYFRQVIDKIDQHLAHLGPDQELNGDQGIFAEVFGEQELWRQSAPTEHLPTPKATEDTAIADERELMEYHVGLDYAQELFYPTCYSERDGYFARTNEVAEMKRISSDLGVSALRIQKLPADIRQAENPLEKLTEGPTMYPSWGDLSLYMDFWITTVPVAIHHNTWRGGLKSRCIDWWD